MSIISQRLLTLQNMFHIALNESRKEKLTVWLQEAKDGSRSASKTPQLLWKPKVRNRKHKSTPPFPTRAR